MTAGVFIWTYFSSRQSSACHVKAVYANMIVADNLSVSTQAGGKMDYVLSFRRELKSAADSLTGQDESYVKPVGDEYADQSITVASLRKIKDFSAYAKTYFIVTSDAETASLGGFNLAGFELYGPQVDLKVSEGGIRVIKEDSPEHDCSKQGQVTLTNLPVVCLPNHINFRLISDDSSAKPDA